MCGIAGFIDPSISHEEGCLIISGMLSEIQHRGPDNSGIKALEKGRFLGHNRLSIIDIAENSNQPMEYNSAWITYNGEVYNYIELKKELISLGYDFKTNSDTEVILAAYHQWGEDCVSHFIGMWAFAIWDERKNTLFCSRDRFGIKPFYYLNHQDYFYFASEIKALKKTNRFSNELNADQVYRFVQMGWTAYKGQTFFTNIHQLKPGHNLTVRNSEIRTWQYWEITNYYQSTKTYEEIIEEFKLKLFNSITLHLRSDVPIGCCLSGGLDSSSIASIIGEKFPSLDFNTFTIYYDGKNEIDERPFSKIVTDRFEKLHPNYYQPNGNELADEFDNFLQKQDVPPGGSSPFSQYFVMKLAKSHGMKVLLDGQGADEYLVGYMHSFYRLIADQLFTKNGFQLIAQHFKLHNYKGMNAIKRLAKTLMVKSLSEDNLYNLEYRYTLPFLPNERKKVIELQNNFPDRLNSFLYNLITTTLLPNLLHYEDRNSMAFSIEARVPFLDHRLVEFAFTVPNSIKVRNGKTKMLLRDSLIGILPEEIRNRHDKKGFVTPGEEKWLRNPLSHLLDFNPKELPMLNEKKLRNVLKNYRKGQNSNGKMIWRLSTLQYWIQLNSK